MLRFTGQPLPAGCRIAVVANDAIGNFVVVTPLLSLLRSELSPSIVDFWGGTRTLELQDASELIDRSFAHLGRTAAAVCAEILSEGAYDLVVNVEVSPWSKAVAALLGRSNAFVCGPSMDSECRGDASLGCDLRAKLWADPDWTSDTLVERFPFLNTGHISEIFCRLAFRTGIIPPYVLPSAPVQEAVPDVLVATAASGEDKLWPSQSWTEILRKLRDRGLRVGLLGAAPTSQRRYWTGGEAEDGWAQSGLVEDWRGRLTLPQVVQAASQCSAMVCLDNGVLHMACSTKTPVVGLFRHGIHRLWAPRVANLTVITPGEGRAVRDIPPSKVLDAIFRSL